MTKVVIYVQWFKWPGALQSRALPLFSIQTGGSPLDYRLLS